MRSHVYPVKSMTPEEIKAIEERYATFRIILDAHNMEDREAFSSGDGQKYLRMHKEDFPALIAYIRELETEHRWIPVEERLPEEGECVLAKEKWQYSSKPFTARYSDRFGWVACKEHLKCSFDAIFDDFDNITHWMPLPKEPEEEK